MRERGALTTDGAGAAAGAIAAGRGRGALDPRTKIVLVVVASAAVMGPGGLRFVLPALVIGIALACWEGALRRGIGLVAAAAAVWALGWVVPLWWPNGFTAIVSVACAYLIRFIAAIGIGMHVVSTTSPTRLSAALRAWRVPRALTVTFSTVLRFFPVVAAEAAAVLDAMRLRGLVGAGGLLRHPVLSVERFTVPMIAASLRASEDLAASSILRGLGSSRTPTAMLAPRFGALDLILLLVVAALTVAAVILPSPLG
ncbi:cobalt transporter [Leucobacter sp. UCD-THU]|uniref:energy-coupling factor transporter transmembrane component T n=1 Tax=Leucobacter sp. UCD-THU TaxID=1292023 RepID=UPI0003712AC4|nr:energy-coupling factor transporter transmembrane component T [Leucobacter sp. UCD-THU]EYT54731.1 cobalt transporter [Leucobacter sp. UCD-THU]